MKVLGFDLGASNLRYGLFEDGKLKKRCKIPTIDPLEQIKKIIQKENCPQIKAIGLGVPGPLDFKNGRILNPPNLPSLHYCPFKKILEKNFNKSIFLDNDANCALLGEKWKGSAKKLVNAVMLTLGTGIGSGILIEGKIYRGTTGAGAEIGHILIEGGLDLEKLIQTDSKNQVKYLKIAIYNIQKIFEPEAVILGGGWAKKVINLLSKYSREIGVSLKIAKLGEWAGLYGAIKGALDLIS